ncbi:MAG: RNA 3'-terminal phosphate cyclase [candidate division WOR-3 bacterium]
MIEIDGSYGEGGGQILRTALALSAICAKPFQIYNIRKGRKKPGLLAQHLTGVNATRIVTDAKVSGDRFGSLTLTFEPRVIKGGRYEFDVAEERGSAGAVTLVAQTILPILFFADKDSGIILKGGTHVPFSPPFDYLKEILLPTIANYGFNAHADLLEYGFYPVGKGKISLTIKKFTKPTGDSLADYNLSEPGELKELKIISRVANLPLTIAERQKNHLIELLKLNKQNLEPKVECEVVKAVCPGTYLFLSARLEKVRAGFSALGAKGKPAEKVADEVYEEFNNYLKEKAALDPHLADQLLIFLALLMVRSEKSNGSTARSRPVKSITFTTTKITNHLLTNIWVINQFLPELKIEVTGNSVTVSKRNS